MFYTSIRRLVPVSQQTCVALTVNAESPCRLINSCIVCLIQFVKSIFLKGYYDEWKKSWTGQRHFKLQWVQSENCYPHYRTRLVIFFIVLIVNKVFEKTQNQKWIESTDKYCLCSQILTWLILLCKRLPLLLKNTLVSHSCTGWRFPALQQIGTVIYYKSVPHTSFSCFK